MRSRKIFTKPSNQLKQGYFCLAPGSLLNYASLLKNQNNSSIVLALHYNRQVGGVKV